MAPGSRGEGNLRPLLEVGRIARPHGLLGEVVVSLVTNRTGRLAPGAELTCSPSWVRDNSGRSTTGDPAPAPAQSPPKSRLLKVRSARPFQQRYLVQFEGVHTREAADELRDALLFAPAVEDPEALFVHDLVGSEVVEVDGTSHGKVVALQANPASDLLVMEDGSLVPLRFVVAKEQGRLLVEVPAGLFE
jgi:16S rRNA processing protein RimM